MEIESLSPQNFLSKTKKHEKEENNYNANFSLHSLVSENSK